MKIAIVNLDNTSANIQATSVIRGIKKQNIESDITVVTSKDCVDIYKYNNSINRVIPYSKFKEKGHYYDLLINLSPMFSRFCCPNIKVADAIGFNFCDGLVEFKCGLWAMKNFDMNMFQLYYKLAGLKWKGEGYDLGYYPKTKTKKNRVGIAVANTNLRSYILNELKLDSSSVWNLPHKKNIFRKMDEINKCKRIITDDMTIFHLAISLRKYVYFLKTFPLNFNLELFKSGEIYDVPLSTIA